MNVYSVKNSQKILNTIQRAKNEFKPEPTSSPSYRLAAQVYSLRGYDLSVVNEI
jgi:hypothetical protein